MLVPVASTIQVASQEVCSMRVACRASVSLARTVVALLILVFQMAAPRAVATVLTGPITDLPEGVSPFYWGDGVNDLYQTWSVRQFDSSGWFYGTDYYPWVSNADVYIYRGLTDPTGITNAETFPYSNS
jgi:hypothetical protein